MPIIHLTVDRQLDIIDLSDDKLTNLLTLFGYGTDGFTNLESWLCITTHLIIQVELSRFLEASSKTHELSWLEASLICSTCFAMASHHVRDMTQEPLLPNLVGLSAKCLTAGGLSGIQEWIPLSIKRLAVSLGPKISFSRIVTFIENIHPYSSLTSLHIHWDCLYKPGETYEISRTLSKIGPHLTALEALSTPVDIVHDTLLDAFSGLRNLIFLEFTSKNSSEMYQSPLRRSGGFEKLQELRVCELSSDRPFIRATNPQLINKLHVTNACAQSLVTISQLCTWNLRELKIQFPLSPVNILSLSACRNLEILDIQATQRLSFSDSDLWYLLGNWTKITFLSLNPQPICVALQNDSPPLTIGSLVAVAQSGPNLRHFACCLFMGEHVDVPADLRTWETLETLDLGKSVCVCEHKDCEKSAGETLKRLFPRARVVVDQESGGWVRNVVQQFEAALF